MCEIKMLIFICGCKALSYQRCESAIKINANASQCPFLGEDDDMFVNRACVGCNNYLIQHEDEERREAFAATHPVPPPQVLGTRALQLSNQEQQWIGSIYEPIGPTAPVFSSRGREDDLRFSGPGPQRRWTTETEAKTLEYDERMRRRIRDATLIMHRNLSAPFDSRAPDCRPPSQIRPRKKTVGRFISEKMKALIGKFSKDKDSKKWV